MTERLEGQELLSESARVRTELRVHVDALAAVVAELREVAQLSTPPVQQEAEHPRTSGDAQP